MHLMRLPTADCTVWLIPTDLQQKDPTESVLIPITHVPYRTLRHLFQTKIWEQHRANWFDTLLSCALNADVPFYTCLETEELLRLGLEYTSGSMPAELVFSG